MTKIKKNRDDKDSKTYGPYHTHTCAWCRGNIVCFNGPDCDIEDGEMHCTTECYNHEGEKGRAVGNSVGPVDINVPGQ